MAGGKGNYLNNAILDHVIGNIPYTTPGTLYFALFTSAPTGAGGGTEVSTSGTSYGRIGVVNNSTNFPAATSQQKKNAGVINFGTATGNWGTITTVGVYDASSGGNLLYWGPLTSNKTINTGDSFQISANNAIFTEA